MEVVEELEVVTAEVEEVTEVHGEEEELLGRSTADTISTQGSPPREGCEANTISPAYNTLGVGKDQVESEEEVVLMEVQKEGPGSDDEQDEVALVIGDKGVECPDVSDSLLEVESESNIEHSECTKFEVCFPKG